ncbi:MAG: selenocysteine-specific translation elongation factor [Chloroflexi bacterium]|nr:selenocysteine-specific translation elongation factor [Chloroflexota bacterium]|tara:strand:+ start:21389 stop:23233 length:1845 start_codon:yes stop_codon:yes gene_type:complete
MYVIATSGHVDHGKSSLVKALTGIDPDRLSEEKSRGMTIDLGFSWLKLANGNEVSIVDVPGHQKFIDNMVAGVGSIDLAVLVVAADESVMPQTIEHISILNLLQIKSGIIVLTKTDLVDKNWLELVRSDVLEVVEGTFLEEAPIVDVSVYNLDGIELLKSAIEKELNKVEIKSNVNRPRVFVDRSFSISGFGTIVTGTLLDGDIKVGDELRLVSTGLSARIRGIQTHKKSLQTASPGTRIAINLSGVSHNQINQRGEVLIAGDWLVSTIAIDVKLCVLPNISRPLKHNMFISFHSGTFEIVGRLRLLYKDIIMPGQNSFAQIKFNKPVSVIRGDKFIIRSSQVTLGGGEVIEVNVPRHKRNDQKVLDRLLVLESGSDNEIVEEFIKSNEPIQFDCIKDLSGLADINCILNQLLLERKIKNLDGYYFTFSWWEDLVGLAKRYLSSQHKKYPLRYGHSKESLRGVLDLAQDLFNSVIESLISSKVISEKNGLISIYNYKTIITGEQKGIIKDYIKFLETNPYSPSNDFNINTELLNKIIIENLVVKVSEKIVFSRSSYEFMLREIIKFLEVNREITIADVRDLFKTSRKYALSLMDYLDKQEVTKRIGDIRVLREN